VVVNIGLDPVIITCHQYLSNTKHWCHHWSGQWFDWLGDWLGDWLAAVTDWAGV